MVTGDNYLTVNFYEQSKPGLTGFVQPGADDSTVN
jgi:hypothetical protein